MGRMSGDGSEGMVALTHSDRLGVGIWNGGGNAGGSKYAKRDEDHIHVLIGPDASKPLWIRIDGGKAEGAGGQPGPLRQAAHELAVGRHKPGRQFVRRHFQGRIYEIIIINSRLEITNPDFLRLEGYLAHKWGLAAKLPADHPYKDMAPTKSP
jgi:hypothetical protein